MNIDVERLKTDAAYWDEVAPYAHYAEPVGNANLAGVIFYDSTPIKSGMIKRPEPTQWTGEGLPPVGTDCEGYVKDHVLRWGWHPVRVIMDHRTECAVYAPSLGLIRWCDQFRPTRTPRDRWVEAAQKIGRAHHWTAAEYLAELHDALVSGQLPLPEVDQ